MKEQFVKKISLSCIVFVLVIILAFMSVYAIETGTESSDRNYQVSIDVKDNETNHTYEAYQILVGDLFYETQGEGEDAKTVPILSNVKWGNGINSENLLNELKADDVFKVEVKTEELETTSGENKENIFSKALTASEVAKIVDTFDDDSELSKAFASHVGNNLQNPPCGTAEYDSTSNGYTISNLSAGYYFIKDKDNTLDGQNSAYTRYVLRVVNDAKVSPKSEKPSVNKSLDLIDDVNVIDHAINESFNYYLTATLPANKEFDEYESYKLIFTDTMSKGITFENIYSVEVKNGDTTKILTESDYEVSKSEEESNNILTVTIKDLKNIEDLKLDFTKETKVIVTYSAHLNENSVATQYSEEAQNCENINSVTLKYSNNPNLKSNSTSEEETQKEFFGETPIDKNYIFTYEVDNTKWADNTDKALPNAGFRLYEKDGTTEVPLKKVTVDSEYYIPVKDGEEGVELVSDSEGKFNIKGLDEGTYILKETSTPGGYNTCDDIEIVIKTTMEEDKANQTAKVTFDSETQNMSNKIVDIHGVNLPRTGATTLVIICGASTVLVVVGLILSKKNKED